MTGALAAAATLLCLAFAMSTWERWLRSRREHDRSWTIALAFSTVAAGALCWGAAQGWSTSSFRVFYACGAIANVPFLALGQLQLAGSRRTRAATRPVHLAVTFALGVLTVAPAKRIADPGELPQGSEVFGAVPRILAAVGSAGGAAIVLGGAVWSTVALLKARRADRSTNAGLGQRALGTALVAGGTILLGASGSLNSLLGAMRAFSVTLVVGMAVLFAGFLVASTAGTARAGRERSLLGQQQLDDGSGEDHEQQQPEDDQGGGTHPAIMTR